MEKAAQTEGRECPTTLRPAAAAAVRRALARCACALAVAACAVPAAQAQALTQTELRARFLLNFLRFTEWPASAFPAAGTPVTLCVLGEGDPFAGALGELHDSHASGRKIAVRLRVAANQADECHLLYVPDADLGRVGSARSAIGRRPVLVVGESEAVLDHGGMIALNGEDQRLGFVVHMAPARRANLRFSPQMLNAAAKVIP